MIKYIVASVRKQGCQVIEVENVEPEDGILTERRAVLPVADFVGALQQVPMRHRMITIIPIMMHRPMDVWT